MSHKCQKFPAQELTSSSSSRMPSSSHASISTHPSSASLQSSGSVTSLTVDALERSFVPRQKLLMMTIDDKTVSSDIG